MGGSNLMSAIAGRVLLIPKGNYDSTATYTMLDMVVYNGSSYICKQECTGVVPTNTTYWMLNASGSAVAYINDIGDVVITNPTNEQVLMYDNATQKWVNGTLSTTLAGLTDTQIASLQNGQVLKYNATSQKWENADEAGGILPHLIVISETGSTVTATKGTTVITATETSTGHFECDVPEFGTWTIDAILSGDDAQVSLVVDTVKVYTVDDSHFHANVTVKYPSGATCNLAGQGESYYATGSPYTFTVHHAGQYTITVVHDGQTYTETVTVTTTGETFSKVVPSPSSVPANDINWWLFFGGVSGSYSTLADILADSTALATLMASTDAVDYLVRCTDWASNEGLVPVMTSATTPSGVVICNQEESSHYGWNAFDGNTNEANFWSNASSGFPSYLGYNFGEPVKICRLDLTSRSSRPERACKNYKIQGSNNGTDWTDIYSGTFAQQVNNTISFANDVAYSYYRLYIVDVYSGSECNIVEMQFYKLTQSIPENSTAMTYIGLNNYASNTLLADADWLDGICDSEYFESVLNAKIPTMTSDTTPSGVCYGTNPESNSEAYKAFDNDDTTAYSAYNGTTTTLVGEWLSYEFTNLVQLVKVAILFFGKTSTSSYRYPKVYSIQGYDGSNWVTLYTRTTTTTSDSRISFEDIISPSSKYIKFRLLAEERHTSGDIELEIFTMQFYGREDV